MNVLFDIHQFPEGIDLVNGNVFSKIVKIPVDREK